MSSQHSFFENVVGSSFDTPAFARSICKNVCVDLFAKSNGVLAIVGTAKLSSTGVTNSNALCKTHLDHVLSSTSAADPIVVGSFESHRNFSLHSYLYPLQCHEESETS